VCSVYQAAIPPTNLLADLSSIRHDHDNPVVTSERLDLLFSFIQSSRLWLLLLRLSDDPLSLSKYRMLAMKSAYVQPMRVAGRGVGPRHDIIAMLLVLWGKVVLVGMVVVVVQDENRSRRRVVVAVLLAAMAGHPRAPASARGTIVLMVMIILLIAIGGKESISTVFGNRAGQRLLLLLLLLLLALWEGAVDDQQSFLFSDRTFQDEHRTETSSSIVREKNLRLLY
jgi:hypothetical protein